MLTGNIITEFLVCLLIAGAGAGIAAMVYRLLMRSAKQPGPAPSGTVRLSSAKPGRAAMAPVIESYRAELRTASFDRLDEAATERLRQAYAAMRHSNAIEGIHPTPELVALFDMLVEERAPPAVTNAIVDRYVAERIVAPAKLAAATATA